MIEDYDVVQVGSVPLGEDVYARFTDGDIDHISNQRASSVVHEVHVIAKHGNLTVLGFVDRIPYIGWGLTKTDYNGVHYRQTSADIRNYIYGWEIGNNEYVGIKRVAKIVSPGQTCSLCKLPAPHFPPNTDGKFTCKGCIALMEISG